MWKNTTPANVAAMITFVLAKSCAFGAVCLGWSRELYATGAVLMVAAWVLLIATLVIAYREMKRQNRVEMMAERREKIRRARLSRMIEDGTLARQLQGSGFKLEVVRRPAEVLGLPNNDPLRQRSPWYDAA